MSQHESGFTLVELVVSIAILGILMAALVTAATVVIDAQNMNTLEDSRAAQIGGWWFATDAQSAQSPTPSLLDPTTCTTSLTPVVSFAWTDPETGTFDQVGKVATYYLKTPAGQPAQLWRRYCVTAPGGSTYSRQGDVLIADANSQQ